MKRLVLELRLHREKTKLSHHRIAMNFHDEGNSSLRHARAEQFSNAMIEVSLLLPKAGGGGGRRERLPATHAFPAFDPLAIGLSPESAFDPENDRFSDERVWIRT